MWLDGVGDQNHAEEVGTSFCEELASSIFSRIHDWKAAKHVATEPWIVLREHYHTAASFATLPYTHIKSHWIRLKLERDRHSIWQQRILATTSVVSAKCTSSGQQSDRSIFVTRFLCIFARGKRFVRDVAWKCCINFLQFASRLVRGVALGRAQQRFTLCRNSSKPCSPKVFLLPYYTKTLLYHA